MIPVSLKISGFLSYQEPVELDFSNFDLACVSGANGAGKSSLLDAITWVLFGQARRHDDAVINKHSDGAEVTLDFDYEGQRYRVQRSKAEGKSTALDFLVQDQQGRWRSMTEHTMRDTEGRIEQTLRMDYETFINASFFLQDKADQFAQQRPGDRKRILSSILGLEIWETYRENASKQRKNYDSELTAIDTRLAEIEAELQQESERKARLKALQEDVAQIAALRKSQESALDSLHRLAASLAEQRRLIEVLEEQLSVGEKRLDDRQRTLQTREEEFVQYQEILTNAAEVEAAYQNWQKLRQELEQWEKVAANFRQYENQRTPYLMSIESERSKLDQKRKTLSQKQAEVGGVKEQLPDLHHDLDNTRRELRETSASIAERQSTEENLQNMQSALTEALAENKRLKNDMNELKERIDQLKETSGANCPLCGQPLNADERRNLIIDLESQGKTMGDQYRTNQELLQTSEEQRAEMLSRIEKLKKLEPVLREQQRRADQVEDRIRQINESDALWEAEGSKELESLEKTMADEDFALEARQTLIDIDAHLKDIGYDSAAHDAVRQAEQEARSSETDLRNLEVARSALEPLKREINELKNQLVQEGKGISKQEKALKQAQEKYQQDAENLPDISRAEKDLFNLQEQENRLRQQVGGALQTVEVLKTLKTRQIDFKQQRQELAVLIDNLKTLERAFSKDGVPALLIEQALPEIEMQANEVLDRLTAGRMSVRFETQQDYKDKKRQDKRETLDILISDSAGTRDYALFSGGEAFRVNFAIRLALSRVLAQRAGARLQTLVIDEGFGSQDTEGRQRLVEAINMVKDDFAKILVITHLEELKDAFPTRIEVEKTLKGSQLRIVQ